MTALSGISLQTFYTFFEHQGFVEGDIIQYHSKPRCINSSKRETYVFYQYQILHAAVCFNLMFSSHNPYLYVSFKEINNVKRILDFSHTALRCLVFASQYECKVSDACPEERLMIINTTAQPRV